MDKKLQSFSITTDLIDDSKELFRKFFKNKMSGIVLLSKNSFIMTNIDLLDILTHTFKSADAINLIEVKNEKYHKTLETLLALNSDGNYTYLSRDHFLSNINHFERIRKFYKKVFNCNEDELNEVFLVEPIRKINGEVLFTFSFKLREFILTCYRLFYENEKKIYNDEIEKAIYASDPKTDVLKSITVMYLYLNEDKKAKKNDIGKTTTHRVISSLLGTYFDHIQELIINKQNLIEENLLQDINYNKINFYFFKLSKKINGEFSNRKKYTLKIPVMVGVNHPVPDMKDKNITMTINLWKEEGSIRHFVKYNSDEFDVITFLPFSIFYLPEGEI